MPTQVNKVWKGSPNFSSGRQGMKPEAIVVHVMDGTLIGTDSWFANPISQVSAHYGLGKGGEVHQYVKEEDTAWHAGRVDAPTWSLMKPGVNPNRYTIGIEHEGNGFTVWSVPMKQTSAALIREICTRWQIPIDRNHIIGHYQIYSKKPNCPAANKTIIDELIALATVAPMPTPVPPIPPIPPVPPTPPSNPLVTEGIRKIEEGLALIRAANP